jgi:hypothetical protein
MVIAVVILFELLWLNDCVFKGCAWRRFFDGLEKLNELCLELFSFSSILISFLLIFLIRFLLLLVFILDSVLVDRILDFFGSCLIWNKVGNFYLRCHLTHQPSEFVCSWCI